MNIFAVDPGSTQSAWVLMDSDTYYPIAFAKQDNERLLARCLEVHRESDVVAIEAVSSYGMAVGSEVFDTVFWGGRFYQAAASGLPEDSLHLVKRHPIKLHHCRSAKANDTNIRQALVDRFAPGERNHGKGVKAAPGFFYGFAADCWQAFALAVYMADTLTGRGQVA